MSIFKDERTEEHSLLTDVVGGTDTFMSGWGRAEGGRSLAFWACEPSQTPTVRRWVMGREEFRNVRSLHCPIGVRPTQLSKHDHCHIYIVGEGHPALKED